MRIFLKIERFFTENSAKKSYKFFSCNIIKMHHVYSKVLLLVALVLAIVAVSTKDWLGTEVGGSDGLFPKAGDEGPDKKDFEACQGLAISSIVLLALSLGGSFVPAADFKHAHAVTIVAALLGVVLMMACVVVWLVKIKKDIENASKMKTKLGYSFYLACAAAVVGGLASIFLIAESDDPLGHLSPGLRPPTLTRAPRKVDSHHTDSWRRSLHE